MIKGLDPGIKIYFSWSSIFVCFLSCLIKLLFKILQITSGRFLFARNGHFFFHWDLFTFWMFHGIKVKIERLQSSFLSGFSNNFIIFICFSHFCHKLSLNVCVVIFHLLGNFFTYFNYALMDSAPNVGSSLSHPSALRFFGWGMTSPLSLPLISSCQPRIWLAALPRSRSRSRSFFCTFSLFLKYSLLLTYSVILSLSTYFTLSMYLFLTLTLLLSLSFSHTYSFSLYLHISYS
jgi:hypothetical protein